MVLEEPLKNSIYIYFGQYWYVCHIYRPLRNTNIILINPVMQGQTLLSRLELIDVFPRWNC